MSSQKATVQVAEPSSEGGPVAVETRGGAARLVEGEGGPRRAAGGEGSGAASERPVLVALESEPLVSTDNLLIEEGPRAVAGTADSAPASVPAVEPGVAPAPAMAPAPETAQPAPGAPPAVPPEVATAPASPLPIAPPADLGAVRFPMVDWTNPRAALDALYRCVVKDVESSIDWYIGKRRFAKKWAQRIRTMTIVCATMAAITPILIALVPSSPGWSFKELAPLASVFAALGAGLVGLDKFYGFSSGWMRGISTELELRARLNQFQLAWLYEQLRLSLVPAPDLDQVTDLLFQLKAFVNDTDAIINAETRMWMEEFQGSLAEFEKMAEAQRTALASGVGLGRMTAGALQVRVAGLETLDSQRWEATVGDKRFPDQVGKSLVVGELRPGLITVRVRAQRRGQVHQEERAVLVQPGQVTDLVLDLSA